jgi:hypothetical protein
MAPERIFTVTTPTDITTQGSGFTGLAERSQGNQSMIEVASARAAQEVQAAMIIAKRFPRDEMQAHTRIVQACKRKALAEHAMYAYPRGGQMVTGPSIRLAEVLAQSWGNLDCGLIELEQRKGESTMMAYAWDLETNSRNSKTFQVRHERKSGQRITPLTDPRDIYEICANQGARRIRACILAVIPGDIVESAITECEKTLAGNNQTPITDRARQMVVAFLNFGVTQEMIERRLGHKLESVIETELVGLRKIYASIKDGMATRESFFTMDEPAADPNKPRADTLAGKIKGNKQPKGEPTDTPAGEGAPATDAPSAE